MRRLHRVVLLAGLVMLMPALTGCENFDPDKLDVFGLNEKKKLPGDRKPLFPEGVPGVTQGIPPEYLKGNQQQTAEAPAAGAAATPTPEKKAAETASEPKRKSKPRTAARRPTHITVTPPKQQQPQQAQQPQQSQQKLEPWPQTPPQQVQQAPAQQPAQQAQQTPWPQPAQSSTPAPWPSAPPPGTFSK